MSSTSYMLSEQERQFWHSQLHNVHPLCHKRHHRVLSIDPLSSSCRKSYSPISHREMVSPLSSRQQTTKTADHKPKLRKGKRRIDGCIDLHGMTQEESYRVLPRFLYDSIAKGRRCILIITGKGKPKPENNYQGGILRRVVLQLFAEPRFSCLIYGIESASAKEGGTGAFYVLLRRRSRINQSDLWAL